MFRFKNARTLAHQIGRRTDSACEELGGDHLCVAPCAPRDGRFIEEIGTYDPRQSPAAVNIDVERAQAWIRTGAQPTDTVRDLLKKAGV